jgi:MSHA biogenesis protein MshK
MDAPVMLLRSAILLAGWMAALHAAAQSMPDPTRPPFVARSTATGPAAPAEAPVPVLQSILIAKDRRMAIISGQRYDVGDRIGDARIIRISETEVLLRSGASQTTLRLFPQVLKRTVGPRPGHGAAPHQNKKNAMSGRETQA